MVRLHLGKHALHVGLLFLGSMLLGERREALAVRVDARWQPHGSSGSPGGKVRRSMCEAVAPKRAGHLRHDPQIGGRIRKSPARHRIEIGSASWRERVTE